MEIVRFSEIKTFDGVNIFENETNVNKIKEAAFYLHKKTEDMTDEQFIEFLKSKDTGLFMNEDYMNEIRDDFFQDKCFAFMMKDVEEIMYGILELIPMALKQNNIIE